MIPIADTAAGRAWIRERTGTVVAPATLHAAVDLLGLAWLLLDAA